MRRAIEVVPGGGAGAVVTVTLTFDRRHKRRVRMVDDAGGEFLLDLPRATQLQNGDGLTLEDGSLMAVQAAEEAVVDIACSDPVHLARVAWHLGNRHLPVEVLHNGILRIQNDHVIVHMVKGLGASVTELTAPFAPESGAYSGGHGHAHG